MDEQELNKILGDVGKKLNASQKTLIDNQIKMLKTALSSAEVQRVSRGMRQLAKDLNLGESNHKKLNKVLDDQVSAQEDLVKASDDITNKFYDLYRASGKNVVESQRLADATVTTRKTVKELGRAAITGSGRIDDFTQAFNGKFGLAGSAIADIGHRLQSNIDNFRTLAQVGAGFGNSLLTLRETASDAGLPLADFVDLVRRNSESLAALYGSTTLGAQAFANLSQAFRRQQVEFLAPLGFTVDELNSVLLTQLNLNRRTNFFRSMSDQEQIQAATSLALELDKLAKLTGQERTAMAKTIEAQLTNERFLAFLGTQSTETKNRLSAFTASVGGYSGQLAEGFQDLIANAGAPVTQASKDLIMNIPEATSIVKKLTSGSIDSAQAMVLLRDAARRSNESLRGVAQTGQVQFAKLFGEVNKLASANFKLTEVTEEQRQRQDSLTKSFTQFENASKNLSSSFQSIETGFFATIGSVLGAAGGGLNSGMNALATGIKDLNNLTKSVLFLGTTVSSYFLDKTSQILVTAAGVRLGLRGFSNFFGRGNQNMPKTLAAGGAVRGRMGGLAKFGGAGLATGLLASAVGRDNNVGKGLDVASSALSGAALGSMILPGFGTAIGGAIGAGYGLYNSGWLDEKRSTGTQSSIGQKFEPRTQNMLVHKGETVLNPDQAKKYYDVSNDGATLSSSLSSFNSNLEKYNKTAGDQLEESKSMNKTLKYMATVGMQTERNTNKTAKKIERSKNILT